MAVDSTILELLQQTVWVAPYQGRTDSGDPIFGEPVAVRCRMDPVYAAGMSSDGEEDRSTWELVTATAVGVYDRVWVSAEALEDDEGIRVKQVEPVIDETGTPVIWQVLL